MKTISLTEAYAKATKGELSADDDMIDVSDQANMVLDNIGTEKQWQSIGIHDSEGMAEIVALCHPINAALIAHCFNNLKDVVEALEMISNDYAYLLEEKFTPQDVKRIESALAKASTVQMP